MNPTRTKIALTEITKFIHNAEFKLKVDVYKQFPQYALELSELLDYLEYISHITEVIKMPEKKLYYYYVPTEFRDLPIERIKEAILKAQKEEVDER